MPKQPVVSGKVLLKLLKELGYEVVRKKGSHLRLKQSRYPFDHAITIPMHRELAKGTLNDILEKIALNCGVPKQELLERLRNT